MSNQLASPALPRVQPRSSTNCGLRFDLVITRCCFAVPLNWRDRLASATTAPRSESWPGGTRQRRRCRCYRGDGSCSPGFGIKWPMTRCSTCWRITNLLVRRHAAWRLGDRPPSAKAVPALVDMVMLGDIDTMHAHRTLRAWAEADQHLAAPSIIRQTLARFLDTDEPSGAGSSDRSARRARRRCRRSAAACGG